MDGDNLMNKPSFNKTIWIFLIGLVMTGIIVSGAAIGAAQTPQMDSVQIPGKVWILAGEPSDIVVQNLPPKEFLLNAPQTANITVTYVGSWSAEAQAAFEYAVSIWETQITSPIEIKVEASWENLGPGILGGAGAENLFRDFPNAPVAGTWYPVALANKLAGSDLDPTAGDIGATFNSGFACWYFGTTGSTPAGLYDFVSVVLHEIGHGLGFFGTMRVGAACGGASNGCWGFGTVYPGIYDRFTENGAGTALLSFPNNSSQLGTQLTSNSVFFDGPNANAANGNSRVPLYAPGTWQQGSSYSHLAESFNGTANALMTYSLGPGEAQHNPGPVMLGMFADMGWTTTGPTPTATNTSTPTQLPTCTPVPTVTPFPTLVGSSDQYLPLVQRGITNCAPYGGGGPTATPTPTASPTTTAGWTTIVSENFEGTFPGSWELYDTSGGAYQWGKRNCQVFAGSSSGWAIGGGTSGSGLGCGANYPVNFDSWMIYGSFSLVGATDAELLAKGWVLSEPVFDEFCLLASLDNNFFYGSCYNGGNTQGWVDFNLDLTSVPTLGDLRGQANIWIAIGFFSDITITTAHGAYVDNIVLRKCTSGSCTLTSSSTESLEVNLYNAEKVLSK